MFGNDLIEARTQNFYLVNDPAWGYFGGYSDQYNPACGNIPLNGTIDNGHMRLNLKNASKFYDGNHYYYYAEQYIPPFVGSDVSKGWNWIGPLNFHNIAISDILFYNYDGDETVTDGDIIKAKDGKFATYNNGAWVGELTELKAGHGYSYYSNSDESYRLSSEWHLAYTPRNAPRHEEAMPEWEYDGSQFMTNMTIVAELPQLDYPEDYTIGTFVNGECRGEGKYVDGRWFIFAHGEAGDMVSFKVRNRINGSICDIEEVLDFAEMAGSYKAPVALTSNNITGIADVNADCNVYLNGQTIVGDGVEIYDLNGRNVTESNGSLAPGMYIVRSNGLTQKVSIK